MSDKLIYKRVQFDGGALSFIFILIAVQILFTNGVYLATGLICFCVVIYHLQQPLKPSIFSIVFLYHLMQIMAGVWLSNYVAKDINFRSEHLATATLVSYIGMVIMFIPIIYFQNKIPNVSLEKLRDYAEKLSIEKTFNAYIVTFFVTNALLGIAFVIPGLSQVIFSFLNIKWFFFLLFGFQAFLKKRMLKQFIGFAAFEFCIGFFNYFSDFKTVLFFIAFLYITFLTKIYLQQVIVVCLSIAFLFYLAVMWTDIKG